MKQLLFISLTLILNLSIVKSNVWVYPGPIDTLRSVVYKVTVIQSNQKYESFVYQDRNTFQPQITRMTDFNHWTTFSFSDPVQVQVEVLKGSPEKCYIHPYSKNIKPDLQSNMITFELEQPAKLFVRIDGYYENPLFIFADAPETDIPDKADTNVVFFEGGKIYQIGEQYPIQNGKTYYIEGGAYVIGSMLADHNTSATIRGRGILSNIGSPDRHHKRNSFEGVSVHFPGYKTQQMVEGITFTNPSMYCLLSRGKLTCRNVKMFGWQYETDGVGGGDGTVIDDCFFKVNDDVVKLYYEDVTVKNLVIYQQINGAPFQLSWGGGKGKNVTVDGVDLIQSDVTNDNEFSGNRAVINLRTNNGKRISHLTFSNIRADQDIARLIGLYNGNGGHVSHIKINHVDISGKERLPSYINSPIGIISKIDINNVRIQQKPLTKAMITIIGNVSQLDITE